MMSLQEPAGFAKRFDVVSCFLEDSEGRFLVLLRAPHKPQGNTWAVPAGKVKPEESPEEAMCRELEEEVQCYLTPDDFTHAHTVYVSHDGYDFAYHMFTHRLTKPLEVLLDSAHVDHRWVTPYEALTLPLIPDEGPCIELHYGIAPASESLKIARVYLGKEVTVTMDRPLGSKHPKHGFVYEVNYGYIDGERAPDGEDLDAYYLGVSEPLMQATGMCIAIAHRNDDDDDKLIVVPKGTSMTDEEIMAKIRFQEHWFDTVIVR